MRRHLILVATLVTTLAASAPTSAEPADAAASATRGLTLSSGRVLPATAGDEEGSFSLVGASATPRNALGFALLPGSTPGLATSGAGCFCGGAIFADGFESGDVTAWSESSPLVASN